MKKIVLLIFILSINTIHATESWFERWFIVNKEYATSTLTTQLQQKFQNQSVTKQDAHALINNTWNRSQFGEITSTKKATITLSTATVNTSFNELTNMTNQAKYTSSKIPYWLTSTLVGTGVTLGSLPTVATLYTVPYFFLAAQKPPIIGFREGMPYLIAATVLTSTAIGIGTGLFTHESLKVAARCR